MRYSAVAWAGAAMVTLAIPDIASAATAITTTDLNMRAGPATSFPVVDVVPDDTKLSLHGCVDGYTWCDVTWDGARGWVSASYLNTYWGESYQPLIVHGARADVPIIVFSVEPYWDRYYRGRPWYGRRAYWRDYWRDHRDDIRAERREDQRDDRADRSRERREDRVERRQEQRQDRREAAAAERRENRAERRQERRRDQQSERRRESRESTADQQQERRAAQERRRDRAERRERQRVQQRRQERRVEGRRQSGLERGEARPPPQRPQREAIGRRDRSG